MTYICTFTSKEAAEITLKIDRFATKFGTPDIVSINAGRVMASVGAPHNVEDKATLQVTGVDVENDIVYVHELLDVKENSFPIVLMGECEFAIYSKQE